MNYQPIGNTLLLEEIAVSTTIAVPGGFMMGDSTGKFKVAAVGDGDKIPKAIQPGDTAIVSMGSGVIPIKDTKLYLVNAEQVLAKVCGG
jgi:co-chaperonin GroES (HSP10)